jgi:hypothetical protein
MFRCCLPAAAVLGALAVASCSSGAPAAAPAAAKTVQPPPSGAVGAGRGALPALPDLPKAAFAEVMVPAGTAVEVALDAPLASDRNRIEDPVRAHVSTDVVVRGRTVIPKGTAVTGTVLEAASAAQAQGPGSLALRFLALHPFDTAVAIRTARLARTADAAGHELRLASGTTFELTLDDAIRIEVPNP